MRLERCIRGLQAWSDAERAAGRRVALVPTMGALHAGHRALIEAAQRRADRVVVSIFVNPTQFGPGEDWARYPRPLEDDLATCREAGVDVVFVPEASELYPPGCQTWVEVEELSKPLCGRSRPGHFRGVATVVTKLLIAARPHVAVFGEKDYQQLRVIERLVRDLGFDVEILAVPIVREADGLALSSRNAYLGEARRREALALVRALDAAEGAFRAGERRREALLSLVHRELEKAPSARVDYAELCDAETLATLGARLEGPALLALAVRFPEARLIDNRVLREDPS